ncbi:MAG TPA: hypothetical protein VL981_12460 [Candidatus Methylacidiphilales bacterium]|nr:hypothetical protein [Candidatus Methylacidiphilales bacterium]
MATICVRADDSNKPSKPAQDASASGTSSATPNVSTTTQDNFNVSPGGSGNTTIQNSDIVVPDSAIAVPHSSGISLPDPDVNSPTYDGSFYKVEPGNQPTAAEIRAKKEAQDEENNWLIRGYEEQVQEKAAANGQTDSTDDPYQQVLSDKDLAALAGLPPPSPSNPEDVTTLHVSTDPAKNGPALRLDSPQASPASQTSSQQDSSQKDSSPARETGFKPLITPLSATDVAGLPNFYATLPGGLSPEALSNNSASESVSSTTDDPSFTDMPGLIAAKNQFKEGNTNYEITFDPLPDDFQDKKAAATLDKSDVTLTLPQPPSGDAVKQAQRAILIATTGSATLPPAPPPKVVIHADPALTNPKPIAVPLIVAGRPQIQDPNDFFR